MIFLKEKNINLAKNYFYASYRNNTDISFTRNALLNYSKCNYELGDYDLSIATLEKLKSEFPNFKSNEVNRLISENEDPLIIAEIGINHNGSLDSAISIVDSAIKAGAEIIKHQTKGTPEESSSRNYSSYSNKKECMD